MGRFAIDEISTAQIEHFIAEKLQDGRLDGKGGLSVKSVSDILAVIKESFQYAQSFGVFPVCCFDRISLRKSNPEMRVLNTDEQERLLKVLFDHMDPCKLGVFICLYTGIRIGELCALQWKNISFSENTLDVRHTIQRLQSEDLSALHKTRVLITEPKSPAALRTIPLPEFVSKIIMPFASSPDAYILSGKTQTAVEPRIMQNRFKRYLLEGGIEDANFHSLRHTFATRCIESGFDPKTLSEILGHSSVKITMDRYVHSSMQLKRHNMNKLSLIVK